MKLLPITAIAPPKKVSRVAECFDDALGSAIQLLPRNRRFVPESCSSDTYLLIGDKYSHTLLHGKVSIESPRSKNRLNGSSESVLGFRSSPTALGSPRPAQ